MQSWHSTVIDGYVNDWNLVYNEQHGCRPWWNIPLTDAYFRHNLVPHLAGARFLDEMTTLVTRPFWIAKRVKKDSFALYANDIAFAISQLNKYEAAKSKEGMKANELIIIRNALRLSHSFIFEHDAEIWFQLYSRLKEAANKYEPIHAYLQYLVNNAPRPFLCMEQPLLTQAGSGVDMLTLYDSPVSCIAVSEHGNMFLSGCESGLLSTGSVLHVFDTSTQWTAHKSRVNCVALSEDGTLGASGAQDGCLVVIDTKKSRHVVEIDNAHSSSITDVSFCKSDPNTVFSCGNDGVLCCWNARSAKKVWSVKEAHEGKSVTAIYAVNEKLMVSSGGDGQLRFWDSNGCEDNTGRIDCGSGVSHFAASRNGALLAAGLNNGTVLAWNIRQGGQASVCFSMAIGEMSSLFLSANGEHLAIGMKCGSSIVYDMKTKECIGKVERNWGAVTCTSLIRVNDEDLCVWGCERAGVRVREISRHESGVETGGARAICISSDENEIVVAHTNGEIQVVDISSRTTRKSFSTTRRLNVVQMLTDGQKVAYGCEDGYVGIWDVVSDEMIQEWKVHDGVVLSIAISEDGKHMGSSGRDGTVRVWRLEYLQCSPLLIHSAQSDPLFSIYFGEESTSNMVTVSDREATLWNNFRLTKSVELGELMYFAGRYEAFQELGRELSVSKRSMVTIRNRLYLLENDSLISRVGGFEVDILPSCWAFSPRKNTLCVVGENGIVRFGALLTGGQNECSTSN